MAFEFYMDKMLLPIAPSKLQLKVENQNKTMNLINEGEINILKQAGLTTIEFDALIPQVKYPFAIYKDGFKEASFYLERLKKLKISEEPLQFIVTRELAGKKLFGTNIKVSLEDYTINEDVKNGVDVVVSVKLKQYRDYGTKTCNITFVKPKPGINKPKVTKSKSRPSSSKKIGIGSNVIVNGRLHRDSYGKGPGQMRTNYKGKINFVNKRGSHPYHVTTPSGGWQGWVTSSSVRGV